MKLLRVLVVLLMLGAANCTAEEDDAKKDDAKPEAAPAADEGKDREKPVILEFGNVRVDTKAKRVMIVGSVCMKEGILDYLAVLKGGQEYESILSMRCTGSNLHAGLLAIGARPGPTRTVIKRLKEHPPEGMKIPDEPGTPLAITARWELDGKTVTAPAEHLLFNRRERKPQEKATWVFTGSYFAKAPGEEREDYMADVDRTLIAVVYMGSAVINIEEDAGNPYADDVQGYELNTKLVPPPDTDVLLTITVKEPEKEEEEKKDE